MFTFAVIYLPALIAVKFILISLKAERWHYPIPLIAVIPTMDWLQSAYPALSTSKRAYLQIIKPSARQTMTCLPSADSDGLRLGLTWLKGRLSVLACRSEKFNNSNTRCLNRTRNEISHTRRHFPDPFTATATVEMAEKVGENSLVIACSGCTASHKMLEQL